MSEQVNPKIFRKYDIRGIVGTDISEDVAGSIGKAVGTYLQMRFGKLVAVGMDNRLSSPELKNALIRGLMATGCDVVDIGLCTSPLLYFSVYEGNFDGGIIVTASHNPREYNGFKMVSQNAVPIAGEDILEIRDMILEEKFSEGVGSHTNDDYSERYFARIVNEIKLNRRMRVVVDTGNGVAGKFAPELLRRIGCEVIEIFCELDGRFPNHLPNPEHETNTEELKARVVSDRADLGIGIDGDGDRVGIVDNNGVFRVADYAMILLARDYLERNPDAKVLVDVKTSSNVIREIERYGGQPVIYKTGHSLIKRKMRAEGILLGGELSGHLYIFENYYPFDDAIFAAARILEILSNLDAPFSEQFNDLPTLYATPVIDIPCSEEDKFDVIKKVVGIYQQADFEVLDIDGARIEFDRGWAIIRASNTTPILTFRVEAKSAEALEAIKADMFSTLKQFPSVRIDKI